MKSKMIMLSCIFNLLILFIAIRLTAQVPPPDNNKYREECLSGETYYRALKVRPEFNRAVEKIEAFTKGFINRRVNNIANEDRTEDYLIPVVVHVVWTSADENITMAQIQSAIDLLNQNYAAANPAASGIPAAFCHSPAIRTFVLPWQLGTHRAMLPPASSGCKIPVVSTLIPLLTQPIP